MRNWNNRQHEEALKRRRIKNKQKYDAEHYEWIDADTSMHIGNGFTPNDTSTDFGNDLSPKVRVRKKNK